MCRPSTCRFLAILAVLCLVPLTSPRAARAVMGIPDRVPGASLLVPYFEVGVDPGLLPNDTLLTVNNHEISGSRKLHVHVWDIDGNPVFSINTDLVALATYSRSMRDLLNATATAGQRAFLTVGAYYKGFVTIDCVAVATTLDPRAALYPFQNGNVLTGKIYYTRLSQGSAKGLPMVALEAGTAVSPFLTGFYQVGDSRERIDMRARRCMDQYSRGVTCAGNSSLISRLFFRVFAAGGALNGRSDLVVFTWAPIVGLGGPSAYCATHNCAQDYVYKRRDESGATVVDGTVRLDHVVNVLPIDSPPVSGEAVIFDVFSVGNSLQFFHFSINQANPVGHPELTFDAIFEGDFVPPSN